MGSDQPASNLVCPYIAITESSTVPYTLKSRPTEPPQLASDMIPTTSNCPWSSSTIGGRRTARQTCCRTDCVELTLSSTILPPQIPTTALSGSGMVDPHPARSISPITVLRMMVSDRGSRGHIVGCDLRVTTSGATTRQPARQLDDLSRHSVVTCDRARLVE